MVQAMLGARGLIAMLIALATGTWGLHAYPVQTDNVFLALIALKKPVVFHVLTYGYATLWFTTAFLAASLVTSVFAIVAYRYPVTARRRPLPPYPEPASRPTPTLVLGERHFARALGPAPDPTWLTIPQRGLYTGVMILGAVGTGKTSACMYPYVDQLLRWRAQDPAQKVGGLVLEVKGDFCQQVRQIMRAANRETDYLEIGLDTGACYNPLHNDLDPYAVAYAIGSLLNNLFGKSKEPFWQQAYTDLLKFVISLRRIAAATPTRLKDVDRERYLKRRPLVRSAATGVDYSLRPRFGRPLIALVVIASLVLLVAAVNVANLLLARAADRRRDTAVRLALGATRWQLAHRVLLESGIVLVVAASAGVLLAYWCDRLLVAMFQATSAGFTLDVAPDGRALAFACAAASIAFLVFALGPALKSADVDITAFQSASTRTTGEPGRAPRVVLVSQVAMTLVLVAVGNVFVDALISLRSAPLGVDVEYVLDMQLSALPGGYPNGAAPAAYYRTLLDRVQAIPGVASVSLSGEAPFATVARPVDVAAASPGAPIVSAEEKIITDRFFETMRIPLVAGQDFRPSDAERSDRTVIVSDSLARRLFGSDIALGRLIRTGTRPELQALRIVGVVRDAVLSRPQARNTLIIYQNWWQAPIAFPTLVARTRVEPVTVAAAVRDELRQEGREFPTRVRTLEEAFDGSLAQERLLASLSGAFSILGLALAAVGLYGVLAFTVANRTNEIGVRMALGASRRGILRLIVNDALVMLGTGVAIGVPLAWLAVRMASRVLFDAHPSGVLPILSAVALLMVVGVIAASAPALRASSLNPVDALRHD